jgi:hypothetical protein
MALDGLSDLGLWPGLLADTRRAVPSQLTDSADNLSPLAKTVAVAARVQLGYYGERVGMAGARAKKPRPSTGSA